MQRNDMTGMHTVPIYAWREIRWIRVGVLQQDESRTQICMRYMR